MAKEATRYLQVDPWSIVEKGFHPDRARVSESIFSVGNEFMGVRGYFEEGYSGERMLGSFFNGLYEYMDLPKSWQIGPINRTHFLVNAADWLQTTIALAGETLDLNKSKIRDFVRKLDMKTGLLERSFVWKTRSGKELRLRFTRFTSMADARVAAQGIELEPLNFSGTVEIELGLDFDVFHHEAGKCMWPSARTGAQGPWLAAMGELPESGHKVFVAMQLEGDGANGGKVVRGPKSIRRVLRVPVKQGKVAALRRMVVAHTEKRKAVTAAKAWQDGLAAARTRERLTYDAAFRAHADYWAGVWREVDVSITGDPENEQGVRFGIFQLTQTYHGVDPSLNIAAKGLTGEGYMGHTWWDTETYCLPFYLFNNPKAARNLLGYRYRTLAGALARSASDDCVGARYPMSSINGYEGCGCWQHGDLEIHVSAAVGYGIWHYVHVSGDKEFLYGEGIEMLLQICRFYASRGGWGQKTGEFGFYGVMGPDEFHMMVNNNCYTNVLARKCFEWTLGAMAEMKRQAPRQLAAVLRKVGLKPQEPKDWARMAAKMRVPFDPKTGLYEQHDGYFNYPHTDVDRIPVTEFPIYHHWSYFRIFRTDMIKQPDVLLLQFFFGREYSDVSKKTNYDFYEKRCSHESSLSPGVHSILAAELGMHAKAFAYWGHAARLDLDDYNRNTWQGLHTTSMAAAWLNVVYGFGGMRSDGPRLAFKPSLPRKWKAFAFRIRYRDSLLAVRIDRKAVSLKVSQGPSVPVEVFGKAQTATRSGVTVAMPKGRVAG